MKKIIVVTAAVIGLSATTVFACGGTMGGQHDMHQSNTENVHQPAADEGNEDHKERTMSDPQGHSEAGHQHMSHGDSDKAVDSDGEEKK